MSYQSRNASKEASLELSLAATKSLLSDYALRTRQAEATASRLVAETLDTAQMHALSALIGQQIDVRNAERSVQQQAILQATVVALNAAMQLEGDEQKTMLAKIVRDLTSAVTHLNKLPKLQSPSK